MITVSQHSSTLIYKNSPESDVLGQLFNILLQLNPVQFSAQLAVLNNSSIGQHTRHVIEFYQCLLNGLVQGTVDYDARKRNLLLETDLDYTLSTLKSIVEDIEQLKGSNPPLLLAVAYDAEHHTFVETNFLREMVYMIEHSIHHYALIRIGIQENFKTINVPQNFGVAYSTLKHHSEAELSSVHCH
jgi:hypothetical protein